MTFTRTITAAAITAAALLTASPAVAYQPADTSQEWGRRMAQAGVRFHQNQNCPRGVAGFYDRPTRTIHVCMKAIRSVPELLEVVAHEAVHATQHCAAIAHGRPDVLMPISMFVGTHDPIAGAEMAGLMRQKATARRASGVAFSSSMNGHHTTPALEEEAYALEDHTTLAQDLLRTVCSAIR